MTGTEFRKIRKDLKLTQTQFARLLGYTHFSRISYFENDKEPIPKYTERLALMIKWHGIPSEWMLEIINL